MEPAVDGARDGFSWTGSDAWDHPDAVSDGVSTAGGALVGSGGAQFWDFNTGARGWTFSNSYASRVTCRVRPQLIFWGRHPHLRGLNLRHLAKPRLVRRSVHAPARMTVRLLVLR